MNINELIAIIKNKLQKEIRLEKIDIQDKSFLHKNHKQNQIGKFHIKIILKSEELLKLKQIERNKRVYKILDKEISEHIHSLQILIS